MKPAWVSTTPLIWSNTSWGSQKHPAPKVAVSRFFIQLVVIQHGFKTKTQLIERVNGKMKIAVFHSWLKAGNDIHHAYDFVLNPPEDMIEKNGMHLLSIRPIGQEMARQINRNRANRKKKITLQDRAFIIARVNYLQQGHAAIRDARHRTLLKANEISPGLAAFCDSLAQTHLREEFGVVRVLLKLPQRK